MTKSLQGEFDEYLEKVYHLTEDQMPPMQKQHIKRAFFAGAAAFYGLVNGFDDDVVLEEQQMLALIIELNLFNECVKVGLE
jgi:hypothetical protein